jgi:NTE family protein
MAESKRKKINLALQGGGTHGAFEWGVLDRLLDEDSLMIEAMSATSGGAVNAAVFIDGYMKDGNKGAKKALADFWQAVSDRQALTPLRRSAAERLFNGWNLNSSLGYRLLESLMRVFSPYDLNPINYNPLREILTEQLSVDNLQACSIIKLFITATRVYNGQPRVFNCDEITIDVLMASACLPQLFQAVEIEGEPYWDGGYLGNPSLWPFFYHCTSPDILLVQLNPIWRKETPHSTLEITNRLNEITFNSSLIAEVRAMTFVSKLIQEGKLDPKRYKDNLLHMIEKPAELATLNASSKMNSEWDFLCYLHDMGYAATDKWLRKNLKKVGVESSVSVYETFLRKK